MPGSAKYMSVFEKLKSEILEGKYSSARVFPSSTALARRFKTTRATVRRALDLLRNQGLVGSRQGRGTFVTRAASMRTIGFIVPSVSKYEIFPPILAALTRLSREAGYTLVYSDVYSYDSSRQEAEVRELARRAARQRRRPASRTLRPGSRFHRQHPGDGVAGMFNRGGFCNYLRFVASDQRHKEGKNR